MYLCTYKLAFFFSCMCVPTWWDWFRILSVLSRPLVEMIPSAYYMSIYLCISPCVRASTTALAFHTCRY